MRLVRPKHLKSAPLADRVVHVAVVSSDHLASTIDHVAGQVGLVVLV